MNAKLKIIYALVALLSLSLVNGAKISKPGSRIVGGLKANNVEIPYIVSILNYGFHSCGGAILDERTIITAAHCLVYTRAGLMQVHVGTKNRVVDEGQLISVDSILPHEKWNMETMDFDIGLVRLSRSLRFNENVQPIALPSTPREMLRDGEYGMIAGWGLISQNGMGSDMLRYARVPIVNQALCNQLLGGKITDHMFCAGYLQGGIDACQMDSGGPLTIDNKLVGIVSWGVGCALPNKPGVYTRVSTLLSWIAENRENEFK